MTMVKIKVDFSSSEFPEPECDDKKSKLYFIIMIVLASVLGVLLILSCSILIWRKVLRCSIHNSRSTNYNAFLIPGHKSQGFNAQNMRSIMKNP